MKIVEQGQSEGGLVSRLPARLWPALAWRGEVTLQRPAVPGCSLASRLSAPSAIPHSALIRPRVIDPNN